MHGILLFILDNCSLHIFATYLVDFNKKYLEEACVWLESNTTTFSILSSQAEIGLKFLLIIS